MKPINSKERSKQVWQFVFIFFGLALVPVALIFFSYYHVPERISEADNRKLVDYSNFIHAQKIVLEKMAEIDTNIQLLATTKTGNTGRRETNITLGISELRKMDSSELVQRISNNFEHDFDHVSSLIKAQDEADKNAQALQTTQGLLKQAQSNSARNIGDQMEPLQ